MKAKWITIIVVILALLAGSIGFLLGRKTAPALPEPEEGETPIIEVEPEILPETTEPSTTVPETTQPEQTEPETTEPPTSSGSSGSSSGGSSGGSDTRPTEPRPTEPKPTDPPTPTNPVGGNDENETELIPAI